MARKKKFPYIVYLFTIIQHVDPFCLGACHSNTWGQMYKNACIQVQESVYTQNGKCAEAVDEEAQLRTSSQG